MKAPRQLDRQLETSIRSDPSRAYAGTIDVYSEFDAAKRLRVIRDDLEKKSAGEKLSALD